MYMRVQKGWLSVVGRGERRHVWRYLVPTCTHPCGQMAHGQFLFFFFFFPLLFSCLPALAARGADVHLVLYLGRCGGYVRRYNTYM